VLSTGTAYDNIKHLSVTL